MKNNKRYIILIIILVAFFICMYMLIGKDEIEKSKKEITLLVGEDTIWKYSNSNWRNIKDTSEVESYNWKKFSTYLDSKYKGEFYVWNDGRWYLFDENKEAVNYTENFIGVDANFNLNIKEFENKEIEDYIYPYQILEENGISSTSNLTVNTKTDLDIDNDGINESIYIISNVFPIDFDPDIIFTYIFMVKDNKIYNLYKFKEQNTYINGTKPYINSILDADDDGNLEIIISFAEYSTGKIINTLYKFENNQFKEVISNNK